MTRKARRQEHEAAGYLSVHHTQEAERGGDAGTQPAFHILVSLSPWHLEVATYI